MFKYEAGWVVATRSQLRFTGINYRFTCLYPEALFTLIESEMRIGAGERPCFHYKYGSPGPMQTCRREGHRECLLSSVAHSNLLQV